MMKIRKKSNLFLYIIYKIIQIYLSLLNSYSNTLEKILDNREFLSDNGTLDRSLHDASITKEKALKALNGLNRICNNCKNTTKRNILINATVHFKEVVNTYLFAIKIYLEEKQKLQDNRNYV